jgi:hypothetical protein
MLSKVTFRKKYMNYTHYTSIYMASYPVKLETSSKLLGEPHTPKVALHLLQPMPEVKINTTPFSLKDIK